MDVKQVKKALIFRSQSRFKQALTATNFKEVEEMWVTENGRNPALSRRLLLQTREAQFH